MKTMRHASLVAATLALLGCGGAQKTGPKEMTDLAREAAPPPEAAPSQRIDRSVSREAKSDFGEAVGFFREQEKSGWNSDKCHSAAERFLAVASSHEKLAEAYFNAGVAYQKCGDATRAEAQYKKAISINPAHAPSLANLGGIYFRGGNETVGQQYFDQAIRADPKAVAARNNVAWIIYTKIRATRDNHARKKFEDDALSHLSRVLAVDNDNIVAYTIMALIFMEGWETNRSRLDMAKLLLDEGKKRNEKYAPLFNAWGLYYLKRADVGRALEQFRRAVELEPEFTEARMNLAQIVLSFRKYPEAEENFTHVLKQANTAKEIRYDATVGLGVALRGQKKIDEAEQAYADAVKLMPERGDAYYNLGLLWKDFRTNDPDPKSNKVAYIKAKSFFAQYLAKAQGDTSKRQDAQDNVSDCDKYVSQLEQAIQAMEAAPPPTPSQQVPASQPEAPASSAGGAADVSK